MEMYALDDEGEEGDLDDIDNTFYALSKSNIHSRDLGDVCAVRHTDKD